MTLTQFPQDRHNEDSIDCYDDDDASDHNRDAINPICPVSASGESRTFAVC
jgi:hypothetical protein